MLPTGASARSSVPQDNQRPLDAHSRWERLSPEEQQRMREQAKPVWEKHAATIGPETVKLVQDEIEKIRKTN